MTAMKSTNLDRKAYGSSLRPVAKNKIGRPKKPKPQRKPSLDDVKAKFGVTSAALLQRKPMKQRSDKNETAWVDVFEYVPETGALIWKTRPSSSNLINSKHSGIEAGTMASRKNGDRDAIYVQVDGKKHSAHNIVWKMHSKEIPDSCVIDHINRDPWDNRIENLRLASKSQNAINSKINSLNTSGIPGVHFCSRNKLWIAKFRNHGKRIYVGAFNTKEEAGLARYEKIKQVHGDFVPKSRTSLRPRSSKYRGWWDVALVIWEWRPHKCEVCDAGLSDVPRPIFFSHLLPRGSYRRYKRDPRNLVLKCEYHHKEWHNEGPEKLQHEPEWAVICALYFTLRDEANGL